MRKLLLSICAMLTALTASAQYKVGEYIFTSTAKYKVESIIPFEQPGAEWNNFSSEIFSPYTAATEEDYDGIQSVRSDEGDFISYAVPLEYGANYILTMKFLSPEDGTTSITDGAQNQVDAWIGTYSHGGVRAGLKDIDYMDVSSTATLVANEWTEIAWAFTNTLEACADADGGMLNILFSRINTDCVIATNMQLVKVSPVYDTRISDKQIAYAKALMEDANFNTEAAAGAKEQLQGDIDYILSLYDPNAEGYDPDATDRPFDDQAQAEEIMTAFFEDLGAYLDVESNNMAAYLPKIDISSIGAIGRGRDGDFGCFERVGGNSNWGHLTDGAGDIIRWAIQKGYGNATANIAVVSTDFPAGKYFMTAEIRNAYSAKDSWPCTPTYTLETTCTFTLGDQVKEVGPVAGEQFQKFYIIGEVAEDGQFRAQIDWPGAGDGGIFELRAVEVRAFGDEIVPQVERLRAWNPFIAQYNAATSARETLIAKGPDANYPWANGKIQEALDRWDPFYNQIKTDNWVDADGKDTGVATNAELIDWTTVQGFPAEIYGPEGTNPADDYETYNQYAVVRGYQYANNEIVSQNKPIADLKAKLEECRKTDNDAMNIECDHETYESIIAQAQAALDDILANTNDDRQEADVQTINDWLTALDEATQIFVDSGKPKPFVDIDFSGGFTAINDPEDPETVVSYVINGKNDNYPNGAGQMQFAVTADVQPDLSVDGHYWQLGFGDVLLDVLHVGSSEAFVEIPAEEIPGDEDIIRTEFDVWFGNLGKGYLTIELRNAADQRLGGFSIDRYNGKVAFNDFNNLTGEPNDHTETTGNGGTGLNLRQYATGQGSSSVGNAGICIDDNKSSFVLEFDYKARALRGTINNGKNGKCEGAEMPMLDINDANITDNKVAKFVITSNYKSANSGAQSRRCWFDNLKIFRYRSNADGPHFEYNVTPGIKGDVNGDEVVNISDVVAIINTMAGDTTFASTSDVNGDGATNISDVVKVINIMAGTDE